MLDGKFVQGTTPTHQFVLPFSLDYVSDWSITYSDKREAVLKKGKEDCLTLSENIILSTLSQEESFMFEPGDVFVQLKVCLNSGAVLATPTYRLQVEKSLDGVIFDI